jgi:hypothetical protein
MAGGVFSGIEGACFRLIVAQGPPVAEDESGE